MIYLGLFLQNTNVFLLCIFIQKNNERLVSLKSNKIEISLFTAYYNKKSRYKVYNTFTARNQILKLAR